MNEEQVERALERMVDRLNAALMSGGLSHHAYELSMAEANKWADQQYARIARTAWIDRVRRPLIDR